MNNTIEFKSIMSVRMYAAMHKNESKGKRTLITIPIKIRLSKYTDLKRFMFCMKKPVISLVLRNEFRFICGTVQ